MNDSEFGINDMIGCSLDDLRSIPNDHLQRALSRFSETPEVQSFSFQSSL